MKTLALWMMLGLALLAVAAGAQSVPARDYRADFDRSDQAIHEGRGYSEEQNKGGELAWGESYLLMAYMDMYRATGDADYLRHLVAHFDRVLKNRDDVLGKADAFAGKPLAGWGSDAYSGGKWHVWIVHIGMIEWGPSQFVRLVTQEKKLHKEFGAKAAEYKARIAESLRDAEPYWRNGPKADEGYYFEPHLGSVQPTNQQNSLGCVLVEMYRATGDKSYRDKAARLARFFRNRLRMPQPDLYDWAYWPKLEEDGKGSEDISHASMNVTFATLCAAEGIVFTREEIARFGRTWLQKVKRSDGTWADTVGGEGKGNQFMPYSIGLWLNLCGLLPKDLREAFYQDAVRAFSAERLYGASEMVGLARLLRYAPGKRVAHNI
ncbi:MAG TPA: hypothetical protein VFB21_22905 [Chthonomonadaceae bacterium]|nr:hypothetical protein [Chthonomonadaceae bacterium]